MFSKRKFSIVTTVIRSNLEKNIAAKEDFLSDHVAAKVGEDWPFK
jgi:hypothetical protein